MRGSGRRGRWPAGGAAFLLVAALAACTSDDDGGGDVQASETSASETRGSETAASGSGDVAAWCEGSVDLEGSFAELVWVDALPPEERPAALAEFRATIQRQLSENAADVPEEVSEEDATVTRGIRDFLADSSLTPREALEVGEDPEFREAEHTLDEYMLAECGYGHLEVTGVDYAYQGLPDTVPAGAVSVTLTNEGDETHHLFLVRLNDDVPMTFEELLILELPIDQFLARTEAVGIVQATPGESATTFLRMEKGRYGVACFVAEGTTQDTEGSGGPHVALGEFAEFTVE